MTELVEATQSNFLDFRVSSFGFIGGRKKTEFKPGDIVTDHQNIPGIIKFISEEYGAWIEFIDGFSIYQSKFKSKLKLLSVSNIQFFNYQKKYYGFIISLGRVLEDSLKSHFSYVNMIYNGKEVFVRGSTQSSITKRFTHAKMADNHSLLSVRLTPFFNCEIQTFEVKKQHRKTRFAWDTLRDFFIDIDLNLKQAARIKIIVNDSNEYNFVTFKRIKKNFSKFNIRYNGI